MVLSVTADHLNLSCSGNDTYQTDAHFHTGGLLRNGHERYSCSEPNLNKLLLNELLLLKVKTNKKQTNKPKQPSNIRYLM